MDINSKNKTPFSKSLFNTLIPVIFLAGLSFLVGNVECRLYFPPCDTTDSRTLDSTDVEHHMPLACQLTCCLIDYSGFCNSITTCSGKSHVSQEGSNDKTYAEDEFYIEVSGDKVSPVKKGRKCEDDLAECTVLWWNCIHTTEVNPGTGEVCSPKGKSYEQYFSGNGTYKCRSKNVGEGFPLQKLPLTFVENKEANPKVCEREGGPIDPPTTTLQPTSASISDSDSNSNAKDDNCSNFISCFIANFFNC